MWLLPVMLLLAACTGGESTPFPAALPVTETPIPQATAIPPIRYVLAANTIGYVADLDALEAAATVEQRAESVDPAGLGAAFEVVATYGIYEGWTRSPVTPQAMLVVNPGAAPLNADLADLLRRAINPQPVIDALNIPGVVPAMAVSVSPQAVREQFANTGRPDGLQLALGHTFVPGAEDIAAQFAEINVNVRLVAYPLDEIEAALRDGRVQMALVTWTSPEQQAIWRELFGAAYTADLYNLPISYLAVDGVNINTTAGGWPLPRWE